MILFALYGVGRVRVAFPVETKMTNSQGGTFLCPLDLLFFRFCFPMIILIPPALNSWRLHEGCFSCVPPFIPSFLDGRSCYVIDGILLIVYVRAFLLGVGLLCPFLVLWRAILLASFCGSVPLLCARHLLCLQCYNRSTFFI